MGRREDPTVSLKKHQRCPPASCCCFFFAKKGIATGADLRDAFGIRDSKASWNILLQRMMEPQGPEMCREAEANAAESHLFKYNFIYSFSFGRTGSSLRHTGFL